MDLILLSASASWQEVGIFLDELIARVRNTLALTPDPGRPVAEEVNPRLTEEASARMRGHGAPTVWPHDRDYAAGVRGLSPTRERPRLHGPQRTESGAS